MKGPSLWSIDQSSWLQIQRSGFDSRRYQIFWEVMGLEWGPLSLVGTIEVLLQRKSSGSGLRNLEYGRRDPLCWPRDISYAYNWALTSPTSGGRSVGIVRSRTESHRVCFVLDWDSFTLLQIIQNKKDPAVTHLARIWEIQEPAHIWWYWEIHRVIWNGTKPQIFLEARSFTRWFITDSTATTGNVINVSYYTPSVMSTKVRYRQPVMFSLGRY
jgi:hypothetical protein